MGELGRGLDGGAVWRELDVPALTIVAVGSEVKMKTR